MTQSDLISALVLCTTPQSPVSIQENATRCLYNLSTSGTSICPRHLWHVQDLCSTDESHHMIVKCRRVISASVHLLSSSTSPSTARNTLGCLTNISHKGQLFLSLHVSPVSYQSYRTRKVCAHVHARNHRCNYTNPSLWFGECYKRAGFDMLRQHVGRRYNPFYPKICVVCSHST